LTFTDFMDDNTRFFYYMQNPSMQTRRKWTPSSKVVDSFWICT